MPVIVEAAEINPPVNKLPPVTLAVELTRPPVNKLPPVTLALTLIRPVTYSPVEANTATFDVPPMLTVALPPPVTIFTLLIVIFSLIIYDCDYYTFFIFEGVITFFLLSYSSAMPICYKHFPVFKRFTYASMLYAVSRAFIYLITSFGLAYLTEYVGNWGMLAIILPVVAGFIYAIFHFERLEVAVGNYQR